MKLKTGILFLTVFIMLTLCGAVSAGTPLEQSQNGTVSGDLYVNVSCPWPATTGTQNNTLLDYTSIQSAKVYVNSYAVAYSTYGINQTTEIDANGDGDYSDAGENLGSEILTCTFDTTNDPTVYIHNDHVTHCYSDYQTVYDVTNLITSSNVNIKVTNTALDGYSFDGRLKMIALVVAYNDGDSDKVDYWVLNGQDWTPGGGSSSTSTFDTTSVQTGFTNATLNTVACSSQDGTYSFNGNSQTGNLTTGSYYKMHNWDVTSYVTPGTNSDLTYTPGGGSFKMNLATLTVRESGSAPAPAPVANFTATPTSGASPLNVNFTDQSTNSPTSWVWTIEGTAGTDYQYVDSTTAASQNPHVQFLKAGTYNVTLVATNAGGSDDETKTNYITVSGAGPEWAANPAWDVPYIDETYCYTPAFADLDGDGDYDLMIGAYDYDDNTHLYCFENTGTSSIPVWTRKSAWDGPSGGDDISPAFADLDGDDDYDLMIGTSRIIYGFENTGNSNSPIWTANPAWDIPVNDIVIRPALADLDGDGDYDLMIGHGGGGSQGYSTFGYENTGTSNSPIWTANPAWDVDIGQIRGSPALADLDGDGDYDLMISTLENGIYCFENTGTSSIPVWTRKSAWDVPYTVWGPVPALADLDGDGDYDLLIGTDAGIYGYENGGSAVTTCDLTIDGTVNPVPSSTVFAGETNPVTITNVENTGTGTATDILVYLYASDVNGGTTPVGSYTIPFLASGASTSITIVDSTIRPVTANTVYGASGVTYVTYTAVVDPLNTIVETDETNNSKNSTATPVYYNGYKGKGLYEYNGTDINTQHVYDLRGDIVYYTQPVSAYQGVGWTTRTETWNASDLPIPTNGTVQDAWLYLSYNWDTTTGGKPLWTVTLNGQNINLSGLTPYTDQSNFGTYAKYKYGLYVVNVTSQYNKNGVNTLIITPNAGNSNALYPSTLAVIYSNPTDTRKQIFINEQCDELATSPSGYGTTLEEATAYANFTGLTINTSNVKTATLHSFAGSAGPSEGNLLWNGVTIATNAWQGTSSTASALITNVASYLTTNNEAGIQGTVSGGMDALQQFLVVEYADAVPVADFTANTTNGSVPLNVQFTDTSSNYPTTWLWDFGDGTTSKDPNPTHTYSTPGIYTVSLTASNSAGEDTLTETNFITVNIPDLLVTGVDPANGDSDVNQNQQITVTFNQDIQAGTNYQGITVRNAATGQGYKITKTINGNTLTINGNWTPGVTFQIVIPKNSIQGMYSNQIAAAYTSNFTASSGPSVSSFDPADGAVNVKSDKEITVTFSDDIQAGSNYNGITVRNAATGQGYKITKTINGNTLTINGKWTPGVTFQIVIPKNSIQDLDGNGNANSYTSSFTAGNTFSLVSFNPTDGSTDVDQNKQIVVTFSEDIQAGSNYNGITVKNAATGQGYSITKTITGNQLFITGNWTPGVTFQIVIPKNSVKDLSGNQITDTYTSNFTASEGPTVTSFDPTDGATNVARNQQITITFSDDIQAGANYNAITVRNAATGQGYKITKTITGNTLTITGNWTPGTTFEIVIAKNAVKDADGNANANSYTSTFTAGSSYL